jgi:hypothetical protein
MLKNTTPRSPIEHESKPASLSVGGAAQQGT